MKVTEHKTDLGKRAIYNFHVRDDMNDVKVSPSVVDCWYPTSPKQEEILILNKMRNLSEGFDGTPVKIAESRLCLLFMTGNYSKTSNGMYVFDQNGIIMRTRSRFRDFVNRGLLEGSINSPAITFSGLRQLERLVTDSESINNFTHEFLNVVRENRSMITRHEKQIDKLLEKLEVQIATSEKNNRDVVAMAADVVSILSIVPSIMDKIPAIENVIHNLFSFFNF